MVMSEDGAVDALLGELAQLGVRIRLADDGQLAVSAPRGRLTPDLRDRISRYKPELLEWLRRASSDDLGEERLPTIAPDEANLYEPFPPSDLQQSFIIGGREGFEYYVRPHQYMEFDLDELDPERFEQALNAVLRRHRRSLVVIRDDMMMQTVRDPAPVSVTVADLRHLPEQEAQRQMALTRAQMCRQEPVHDRWPWLEPHISLYGDGRARLHYNNNNIFTDAPSGAGLIAEALRRYHDPQLPLPELRLSYRDCVLALAELEESPLGAQSRKYWQDRMAGWPDAPDIPLVPGTEHRGRSMLSRRTMTMPGERWAVLKRRAEQRGLTATNALLGAHAEVLSYWSGSRHFLLNNMISHRPIPLHPKMPEVFGNFASLYPLEVDWRHDEPFHARAHRLQSRVIADVAHSYWSGAKVLQTLNQVRRTPGRASTPFAVGSAFFAGPTGLPYFSMLETPQTLLDTEFWDLPDGRLLVIWDVIEAMFPDGLIDAMSQAYLSLVTRLAEDEAAWESTGFDLLPQPQRRQRADLNRSDQPVPEGLLHAPLTRHAAERPGRPAVVAAGTAMGYGDLYRRVTALAGVLVDHGVRTGDRVAVVLPKGPDQVVAVHAVLTAGAAYVPIDPQWPAERIQLLVEDTKASAVIATGPVVDLPGVPVVPPDSAPTAPRAAASAHAAVQGLSPAAPDGLAYIIYTSGSTGRPKGAMLDHRGPLNTIHDINRRFGVSGDDVVFGVSSLCFDLSVYDVYGTLAAGATLVMPEPGQTDPASWLDLVASAGVTVWNSVPAIMQLFVEAAETAGAMFPALRTVLLSGDWIPVQLPDRIRRIAPNARVVSLGGATEASIWSICYPIERVEPGWASIPYGRPLANQTWHVLDELGRDAPTWVAGHLYIGGTGLALGYLNDPEKTSAAFVTHPVTGERLYRTGDLGRYLPGGDIEFLGRADFQVKIQGFRVEPGEVEHVLLEHPAVGQAAVVARASGSGKQLAAFAVVAAGAPRPDVAELRRFLTGRLPSYLVPSQVVVLDRLPLTANGKLDRRALEALGPADDGARRSYTAPRTTIEEVLVEVWEQVLSTTPIGVHADFFDLGGQSFAALRVIRQVAERLGHRIPLGALLEHRTVAELAEWLQRRDREWSPLVRLADRGGEPWFLVHPAGGHVLCYQQLAGLLTGSCHALQAPSPASGREPLDKIEDMAELYIRALRGVRPTGPYRLAAWSSGATIAAEMVHQLERDGDVVERLVVVDSPAPVAPRVVDDAQILLWFLEDLDIGFDPARVPAERARRLATLTESEGLAEVLAIARDQDVADTGLDGASLAATLAVFRRVVRAANAYQASAINTDITVVRAARSVSEFADHPHAAVPDWGWASLTTGTVTGTTLDCSHHTLLTPPHVAAVAEAMNDR